jgi:UDP-N-acetylmuramate: L-alanyl-gamma-D-glutamyl-meso-diaminopimelate ligase
VHYRPRTLVVNNIEYDHADIFPDLASIQRQFHHLVRTVPPSGSVIHPPSDAAVAEVLRMGLWSRPLRFAVGAEDAEVTVHLVSADGSSLGLQDRRTGGDWRFEWALCGWHNAANAAAASAAALELGVSGEQVAQALRGFPGVKRRLEVVGVVGSLTVYDDFAHHPTAIATTLQGLRAGGLAGRIVAVIEPRSNTMRLGAHRASLPGSVAPADRVYWFQPAGVDWDMEAVAAACAVPATVHATTEEIVRQLVADRRPGDRIIVMSNGGFEGIHARIVRALQQASGD